MMLVKQARAVNFAQGLDTKTDPKQVQMGNFLQLENMVFTKGGLLQKRYGYGHLMSLPDNSYSYLTTFNGNLTALGRNIAAYSTSNQTWISKGDIKPLSLSTLPIIRNNLNQIAADSCVAPNGLVCTVYLESNGVTTTNKYVIANSVTGQNIIAPSVIPVASGTVSGGMRVFFLGESFVIVFTNLISATSHLQYVAISSATPTNISANTDIASAYVPSTTLSWDGFVAANRLYVAYNNTTGSQNVSIKYLNNSFNQSATKVFTGYTATIMSVTADISGATPVIYGSFYNRKFNKRYT